MGKVHPAIDQRLRTFVEAQPVYFVATAPLSGDGHVNLSPKGGTGTLVVLDPHTIAYLDLTASGAETIAHLRENGRITVMVCAFAGAPTIVRLQGTGRVVAPHDDGFGDLVARFPAHPAVRSVVVVDVTRGSDSCGFAVPRMEYVGERSVLDEVNGRKTEEAVQAYRAAKNRRSIDGLPAVDW